MRYTSPSWKSTRRYGHGRNYSNFAERPVDAASFYSEETYRRLREIRSRIDPDGLMRANHEIV